jgi:hypothetical protein
MIPRTMPACLNAQSPQQQAIEKAQADRKTRFQARLSHVIAHENAHASAGGGFAGSPVINADEASGHVSGHVPIRMDFGKTAADALRNARIIFGAAKAPGDPSSQDDAVAAAALSIGSSLAASRRVQEQQMQDMERQKSMLFTGNSPTANPNDPVFKPPMDNPFAKPFKTKVTP